jgi:ionotropic glutamate receptor
MLIAVFLFLHLCVLALAHFRDPINLAVLHLKESGELAKLQHKWWYEKTECKNDKDNPSATRNELSLTNLAGVFYILIGGLLVALAISLVEFCFKSQKSPTTTSLTANSIQMTDTMKPKSRLPITSARDYDNGQVNAHT